MTLLVALVSLATYRLTRLVVSDNMPLAHDADGDPTSRLRLRVETRRGADSWQAYLVNCPWCVSVYAGGLVTLGTDRLVAGGLQAPLLVWGAASAVTGLVASLEPA